MTLHDVRLIHRHWDRLPPLRALVAGIGAALGVKLPERSDPSKHLNAEEAMALYQRTGGRIPGVGSM